MAKFFFTFGQGYSLRDNYVTVEADTYEDARLRFVELRRQLYGTIAGWAFQYDESEFDRSIAAYGLTEVPLAAPCTYNPDPDREDR